MPPESWFSTLCYIDETGYHYADFPTIRAALLAQYQAVYGADVYIADDSQDGQWITIQAQGFYDMAVKGASVYNSFSPVTAQGVGLSRVVKINGLARHVPSYSTVTLTIVGQGGTVILDGIAQDVLGQNWLLPASVTIPGGGTIDVSARAELIGAVFAGVDTITGIFTPTNGWQTVNNDNAAVAGAPVQSDADLRIEQAQSTALPAQTVFDATIAAVANVPGVTSVVGYENDTVATDDNGIPANTVCLVVAGSPVQLDVLEAIQVKKTPGTGTYGNVSAVIFDSQGMPLTIRYQEASGASIQVTVDLETAEGWSEDFVDLIIQAIADDINAIPTGGTNQSKLIFYTTLFRPAYLNGLPQGRTYDITAITVGKNGGGESAANVDLDFDEKPECDPTVDITINVT